MMAEHRAYPDQSVDHKTRAQERKLRRVRNLGDYPLARFIQLGPTPHIVLLTILCVPSLCTFVCCIISSHRLISQALQWPALQGDKKAVGPVYLALAEVPRWEGWVQTDMMPALKIHLTWLHCIAHEEEDAPMNCNHHLLQENRLKCQFCSTRNCCGLSLTIYRLCS